MATLLLYEVEFTPPPAPDSDTDTEKNGHQLIREKDLPHHIKNDKNKSGDKTEATEADQEEDEEISKAAQRLQKDNQLRTALFILKSLRITEKNQRKERTDE